MTVRWSAHRRCLLMIEPQAGQILKGIGGTYWVKVGEQLVPCSARGSLRRSELKPTVGDFVEITLPACATDAGRIDRILPRKTYLIRPSVANGELFVLVVAAAQPDPSSWLMDQMLTMAVQSGMEVILCITKTDLDPADEMAKLYADAGYPVYRVCSKTGEGIDAFRERIAGKTVVFAGASGVGKSRLLNAINPEWNAKTGSVSEKIGRGRHTTRHVELFPFGAGYIADTPGFSAVEVMGIKADELAKTFLEFRPHLNDCFFTGCSHTKEKGCAVLDAVQKGKIAPSRHDSYCQIYEQLRQIKEWEKK